MPEILDEIEIKPTQTKFSKLSFAVSLITLGLSSYLFLSVPNTIHVGEDFYTPPMVMIIATQASCLTGMVLTVLSIAKKEASTWYKWVGGILNVLMFLLILGSVIFARLI